jgi:hypothetical protein
MALFGLVFLLVMLVLVGVGLAVGLAMLALADVARFHLATPL